MSTLPVSLLPASRPQPQIPQRKLIKKGGYTRQRRGCLTCRQRKKKCDQGLPICGHCSRLNLVCKHEKPREVVSSTCGEDAARDSAGSEVRQRWGYDNSISPHGDNDSEVVRVSKIFEPLDFVRSKDSVDHLSSSRRTMMRYYTSTLAIMLSATAENNCFLSG
ncbi:TY1 enhancer activator [Trichoderma asperellum]|uniref:TY1 enhancer activator n=1 Tax=Trichoderma asperellum TaxID=101201 RepID=A0A6V8RBC3_TRIAP|nr:TY1 enhancer activator [Trichoderma asperellum]